MDAAIAKKVQSSQPGNKVELFDIDLTPIDPSAGILRYYPGSVEGTALGEILWQGNTYMPLPIELEGVDVTGNGALPRPILRSSNVFSVLSAVISQYGRIEGAIVTRWETFEEFLDGGSNPHPDAHAPIDVWIIDRVINEDITEFAVETRSFIDQGNKMIPGRQMMRNICTHTTRIWDGSSFDYSKATCPYVGQGASAPGPYFDGLDQPTNVENEKFSKTKSCCRLRFPGQPLPTRAFFALGRFSR